MCNIIKVYVCLYTIYTIDILCYTQAFMMWCIYNLVVILQKISTFNFCGNRFNPCTFWIPQLVETLSCYNHLSLWKAQPPFVEILLKHNWIKNKTCAFFTNMCQYLLMWITNYTCWKLAFHLFFITVTHLCSNLWTLTL